MAADVVTLPGCVRLAGDSEPNPDVIAVLERFLADARSGNLQAVAVAGVRVGGVTTQGWTLGSYPHTHALMAAISYLHARYAAAQSCESHSPYVDSPAPPDPA